MKREDITKALTTMKKKKVIETRDGYAIEVYRIEDKYHIAGVINGVDIGHAVRLLCLPQDLLYSCLLVLGKTNVPIPELIGVINKIHGGNK